MSGVKVTNERPARPIPETSSVEGVVVDENVDWDPVTGGTVENDQWKQPVRVATTADITIATALNAGDAIDGVTLAAGDRVLVKDQSAPEDNGIYVAGTTPERAVDMDDDDEVLGAVVYVIAGTVNTGTTWAVTNVAATVVDTDAIDWAAFGGGGGATDWEQALEIVPISGAAVEIDYDVARKWDITVTENVTYTIVNWPADQSWGEIEVIRRGGSGAPFTETWPAEVDWPDLTNPGFGGGAPQDPPDEGAQVSARFVTEDGGVTVGGSYETSSGPVDAVDVSVADAGGYFTGTDVEAALQELGADVVALASSPAGHAHVVEETHLSDGSTTTWTLDQMYEPGSVIAWNTTTIARLTVTEVLPDKATVSAAGSSGDKIVFDYAATLA